MKKRDTIMRKKLGYYQKRKKSGYYEKEKKRKKSKFKVHCCVQVGSNSGLLMKEQAIYPLRCNELHFTKKGPFQHALWNHV